MLQQYAARAQLLDGAHIMRDKEDSAAFSPGDLVHLAEAFLLELGVADGEDLVDHKDVRLHVSRHGEG